MILTGLHLLWTYQCTSECDHCFAWGSPWQDGTMTLGQVADIFHQAKKLDTIEWVYFEGGEPFLYYAALVQAVKAAVKSGFKVGMVTNAYWATSEKDALECLKPFKRVVFDLTISSDLFHYDETVSEKARTAQAAADRLGIPAGIIKICGPEDGDAPAAEGQIPTGESGVMYKGRAAEKLSGCAKKSEWQSFVECPHEDLRDPGRVHVDPLGYVHVCQGLVIGNLFRTPLKTICETYDPEAHPIIGPLLKGGPAELVRHYGLPRAGAYADACHFCYEARRALRARFPESLSPDQMYGVADGGDDSERGNG
jgi:MoaA/NifB/PqqE/SkfB family radical SAM enzyme